MKRTLRRLVMPLVLGIVVTLALLPVGTVRPPGRGLIASLAGPDAALARIFIRTVTATARFTEAPELDPRGHEVAVTGSIECSRGDKLSIEVILTQAATDDSDGALAQGETHDVCTGGIQIWTLKAKAVRGSTFEPGPAIACALAVTSKHGFNDAHQWCANVTLELAP